ncbi:MAG: 16S rRNA (cytosine(1402)-N(4))-methyltransferase RsmH [Bacteroidetes bacterium]|mgnify:CR=1 FL=1|nr:16S rRNA (cytosine(1402)-N(4))-methyltransferase RsmH [Bacteroidota bacterium]
MAAHLSGSSFHTPVLYKESLHFLNIRPNGIYVDCTYGGGGHSHGILTELGNQGKLIAFDQDKDVQKNLPLDPRFKFIPENFRHIQRFLRLHDVIPVDGILADLGVSSHQFDTGERGFSTRFNGPLDMRMNISQSKTAADILLDFDKKELQQMFEKYGEVSNAKTLAEHIVKNRQASRLKTIDAFKALLQPIVLGNPNKYLAQVFQALRIEVNDELGALKVMLEQLPGIMKKGARCVIISFHSMEDRLVKDFFKNAGKDIEKENPFSREKQETVFELITKKPVMASGEEIKMNPRSRSAKLRVAEKN